MGFDMREARLGLRAARGNVSVAVSKITEQKQRRKEIREKELEEQKKKRMERKLGKTANGGWYVTMVCWMGLEKRNIYVLVLSPTIC